MSDALPRITVVMPSYNQAPFLEEALSSVLEQDHPDVEFFVLDGGSTDGSVEIIKEHADQLDWWRSHPDDGQSAALREGFDRATGDILCWLNSDDRLAPGALKRVADVGMEHGPVMIAGGCQMFGPASRGKHHVPWFTRERDGVVPLPLERMLDLANHWFPGEFFFQPEVFFPADDYRAIGGVDPNYYYTMDYDLWVRLALHGTRVVVIDDTLAWYREHEQQKTDDKAALYDEMIRTANHYLDKAPLPAAKVRRLKRSNAIVGNPVARRAAKITARARHRIGL